MGQLDVHTLLPAGDTVPEAQAAQTADDEADVDLEKVPAGQLVQADDARDEENVPAGQALQLAARADAADAVPCGQGVQEVAPVAMAYEPGLHDVQEEEDGAPMAKDDVPAGQLTQAVALAFA